MKKGKTFNVDMSSLERFGDRIGDRIRRYDEVMEQRTRAATRLVYTTARARRPYITKAQMKKEGRSYRVSDPNAELGVPVQTGRLQASIKQSVERQGYGKFSGMVSAGGASAPYARNVEYGFGMQPRPFMRPAAAINRAAIKKLYNLNVSVNVN